jgi:hypothetical protein
VSEAQLHRFAVFRELPVYDESEGRAASIATPRGSGFPALRECSTPQEVEDCLKNPRLTPLGALRAGVAGQQVVIAYFGVRPA